MWLVLLCRNLVCICAYPVDAYYELAIVISIDHNVRKWWSSSFCVINFISSGTFWGVSFMVWMLHRKLWKDHQCIRLITCDRIALEPYIQVSDSQVVSTINSDIWDRIGSHCPLFVKLFFDLEVKLQRSAILWEVVMFKLWIYSELFAINCSSTFQTISKSVDVKSNET